MVKWKLMVSVVNVKVAVFWDVMSCNLLDMHQSFGGIWSFYQIPPKYWYFIQQTVSQIVVTSRCRDKLHQERNLKPIIYALNTNSFLQQKSFHRNHLVFKQIRWCLETSSAVP
jgi:hypothetical protein